VILGAGHDTVCAKLLLTGLTGSVGSAMVFYEDLGYCQLLPWAIEDSALAVRRLSRGRPVKPSCSPLTQVSLK
jgi:hypothetical protein